MNRERKRRERREIRGGGAIGGIALARCAKLLELARREFDREPALAKRYVELARRIAARHRIHLGSKSFCRKCGVVWIPGKTLRVRQSSREKTVLYICCACNYVRRFPYSRRRENSKQ